MVGNGSIISAATEAEAARPEAVQDALSPRSRRPPAAANPLVLPTGPSVNTSPPIGRDRRLSFSFRNAYNDDLPYWTRVAGRDHLVVPYSLVNNDSKFSRGWFGHGEDYFQFMRDGFDFLHAEGARTRG